MTPPLLRRFILWGSLCAVLMLSPLAPQSAQPNTLTAQRYALMASATLQGWDSQSHLALGAHWAQLGDTARALLHWQFALALTPDLNTAQLVTETLLYRGEWSQALDTARLALTIDPNSTWANLHAGLLLATTDPRQAQAHLFLVPTTDSFGTLATQIRRLTQRSATDVTTIKQMGMVFLEAGLFHYAEYAFTHANTLNYPDPLMMAYVAWMRDLQGKDSARWMIQAVALAPQNADVRFVQGLHLRTLGEFDASVQAFQRAIQLDPQNNVFYDELANTYADMGLAEQAQAWRDQAPGP